MERTPLNDKLITALIDKIESSDKKAEINRYICETVERCVELCYKGENVRVLNEYKLLIDNLRKEFNL